MDDHAPDLTPAQQLPLLYRSVLDLVAELEGAGERKTAYELRRRAIQTYSTRWDEGGRKSLHRLIREGETRLAAGRTRPAAAPAAAPAAGATAGAPASAAAPAAGSAAGTAAA